MQLTRSLTITLLLILITHYVNASLQQITFQDKVSKPADDKPVTITCGADKFIHVKYVTFGANCPKYDYDWNSVLHDWQKNCNGRSTCNRQIPHGFTNNGCDREFEYSYLCSDSNLIIKGELKDDGTYNYWADGRFVSLHCPSHNYVQIVSAIYGQNKGQSLNDNSISSLCDGNPKCMKQILPSQFGNGALKRGDYQYEYICVQKVHTKVDKPANGKTIKLECGTDEFIHVNNVAYAANCPHLIPDYQYAMASAPRWELQNHCDGRQTCDYTITGLSDPAPTCDTDGGREYDYFYVCSKSDTLILQKIDTIVEDVINQIHIECPPNHSIKMVYAMYNSIRYNPVNDPNIFTECHGKLKRCDYEIVLSKITTIRAGADYKYKYICVSPTSSPTLVPTQSPTFIPTISPTIDPTASPTINPTVSPTSNPSQSPTISPTTAPIVTPTMSPSISSLAINSSSAISSNISSSKIPATIATSNSTASNVVTQKTLSPTSSPTRNPTMLSPTASPLSVQTTTTTSVPTTSDASQKESTESESDLSGGTIAAIVIGVSNLMAMIIISYLYKTGFFNHSSPNHINNDNPTEKEPLRNKHKKQEIDIEEEISVSDPGSPPPFDPSEYDQFDDEYLDLHLEDN